MRPAWAGHSVGTTRDLNRRADPEATARSRARLGPLAAVLAVLVGAATASADKLEVQPITGQAAGTAFAVDVHVVDGGNNPVNVSANTTVELTLQSGTGVLGGTVSGVIPVGSDRVTINGVRYDKAQGGVTLRATAVDGDLLTPGLSNAFAVAPGPANQLVFTTQPVSPTTAAADLLPVVTIRDAYGNTVTADDRTITLSFAANPGGAALNGTASVPTVSGVATWTGAQGLNITVAANGYQLRAAHSGAAFAGGTDTVDSAAFNIGPAAAHHLTFTTQPANTAAGAALLPRVTIQDQYNNTVTGDNRTVTLSFAVNPGGGTLNGTIGLLTVNGVAIWAAGHNLNVTAAANGYQLRAGHDGAGFGGSDAVDSAAFNITPATAHHLVFTTQPVTSTAGVVLTPEVTIRDQYNNTTTGDNRTITLTLLNAGGATLSGTTGLLTVNGVAPWTGVQNLKIQKTGAGYQLRASHSGAVFAGGTDTVDSAAFNITPAAAHHLAFTTQPVNTAAGAALVPVVTIQDQYNNAVTGDERTIALSFAANPGATTLNGTTSLLTVNGVATWTGAQAMNITVVASAYQLHAAHDGALFAGTDTVDSNTFNITPAAAHHLVFTTQPATSTAGVVLTPAVTIRDQYDNTVTGDNRTITLTLLNAGGATLIGTVNLLTTNGVATWSGAQNLNIQKIGTGYQLRATHSGAGFGGTNSVDSAAFDITAAVAHHLAFTTQPVSSAAGAALLPQVAIQDQYNNTVTGSDRTITLTLLNAGGATLAGTTSLLTVSGVAAWTGTENLRITKTGVGYQLHAVHDGGVFGGANTVDSNAFNITPAAAHHLAFTVEPVTSGAGLVLQPQVTILDQYSNTVTGDNRTIALSFAANPGSAALNGTTSLLTVNGVATWTGTQNLNITVMATGYRLQAAHNGTVFAGTDTIDSASFDITVGLAHHLAFGTQPVNTAAGVALVPAVAIQDQYNNTVTTDNRTISLTLRNGGGAALAGTQSLLAVNGVATWTGTQNLRITQTGTGYQLRAAHDGAVFTGTDTVDSAGFDITPDVAHHLVFSTQPSDTVAGVTLSPQVTIQDQYNNTVTGDVRTIMLSFAANPGAATLNGTASLATVSGVATWTGTESLDITVAASGYRLRAAHSGAAFAGSETVDSNAFNITPAAAHDLEVTVQPVTSPAGAALQPAIRIKDQYGNTVTGDSRTISLSFAANPGGATLNGTASLPTVSGVATWTGTENLNITVPASGYRLRAGHSGAAFAGGTDTVDTAAFDITPAAAHYLAFTTQPVTTTAGAALVPQVRIRDQYNNTVTGDNRTLSLTLLNAGGATLNGTASLLSVNGVVTWTGTENLRITKTGTGYQLRVAHDGAGFAGGTDTADSTAFNITPDVADHLAFTVEPGDTTAGQPLLPAVTIRDQFANTVTADDRTITLTLLNAGGAVLGGTNGKLSASGVATWTGGESLNIQKAGTGYELRAAHSGAALTGSDTVDSATFAILAETAAHHLAFTVQPSTTAAGGALLPQVTIQDQFDNTVTTVTRDVTLSLANNPGSATLGGTVVLTTSGGVAAWTGAQNLNITPKATGYTLRATGSGAFAGSSVVDSNAFDIVPAAAHHLRFTVQPISTTAGLVLTPQVTIRDAYENPVTGDDRTITLALLNAGGATLGGATSLSTTSGVATWAGGQGLDIQKAGTGYQLRAGHGEAAFAGVDTVDSNAFNITAEAGAHHLEFTVQAANTAAGAALLPQLTIRDQFNNTVTTDDRDVTLTFAANPGSATMGGFTTLTTVSGVATWLGGHNLNIATAASGYRLRATGSGSFGGSATVDGNAFNITPIGLHHFDVVTGANPVTVGQVVTLTITARDVHGNAIPNHTTTSPITLVTNTGGPGSNLAYSNGPAELVDHNNGTATITTGPVFDGSGDLSVDIADQRAEAITVTVSDGVVNNGTVGVSWNPDATLSGFLLQASPSTLTVNVAATLTLTARDAYDNPMPNYCTAAPITIATNTGGDGSSLDFASANPKFVDHGFTATLSAGTVFDGSGRVTLTLANRLAETITITAGDGGAVTGGASVTWTSAPALLLDIQTIPAQTAGSAFTVTIRVTDQFHNSADVLANTDVELQVTAGTGALGGTLAGTIAAGTHSLAIGGVTYDRAENGVVLSAHRTVGDFLVSGTSNAFNVTGAAAVKLVFDSAVIGNQVAGQAFSATIKVLDSLDNLSVVPADTDVILSILAGTGSLIGQTTGTITTGSGAVTIAGVKYDRAEGNIVLRVSRTSGPVLTPGDCAPFTVAPAAPSHLAIESLSTQAAEIAFAVVVDVLDDYDNLTGVATPTTVQLDLTAGTGTLGGTLTRTISSAGRSITFSATYDTAEANVHLRARATAGDVLTEAQSNAFIINASPPVRLRFDPVDPQTAGIPFGVTIVAVDMANNPASVSADTLVTLVRSTGRGQLGGQMSSTIVAGTSAVTLAGVTYDTAEGGVSLWATCSSGDPLASTSSNLFSVAAGAGVGLRFVEQPTNIDVTTPLAVSIEIVDALGNRAVAGSAVTLGLIDSAGCGGALSGTVVVSAVSGLASFTPTDNVIIPQVCSGYRLRASAAGLGTAESERFNVSAGTNLAVAALNLTIAGSATELLLTYTITGVQTVPPFAVAYGLKRENAAAQAIDRVFRSVDVSHPSFRTPGTHGLALGDIRGSLDGPGIRNGDRIAVVLDTGDAVDEADESDNVGAVTLTVDLALDAVLPELHADGAFVRVLYSVNSPGRVQDFVIRVGFDANGDGVIDDPLSDITVQGADAAPGPHVATVAVSAAELAHNRGASGSATIIAVLDATGQVLESDESGDNQLVASQEAYAVLAVTLANSPDYGVVGDELECTWRLRNDGLAAATDIVLSVAIPDGTEFVSAARASVVNGTDIRVPLSAWGDGNAIMISVGIVEAGGAADVVIVLRPQTVQTLSLQAELTAAGGYSARSATALVDVAEPSAPTTRVPLCGGVGPLTLSACLVSLIGARVRCRPVRRRDAWE